MADLQALADALLDIVNMPKEYGEPFLYEEQQDTLRTASDALRAYPAWRPTHRHYKGGLYRLLHADARNEGNDTPVVVYQGEDGKVWVRTAMMFNGVVELEHGEEIRRFEPLPEPPTP